MLNTIYTKKMKLYKKCEIFVRYHGKKIIAKTYLGFKLIWEGIRSCFGAGYWINDKPYDNEDRWVN